MRVYGRERHTIAPNILSLTSMNPQAPNPVVYANGFVQQFRTSGKPELQIQAQGAWVTDAWCEKVYHTLRAAAVKNQVKGAYYHVEYHEETKTCKLYLGPKEDPFGALQECDRVNVNVIPVVR